MTTKQKKPVAVTRKFLLNLADKIYNTKTKKFLRLCDGTLQNGPDPTNPKRPMHCGLGELWFAMTGVQPEESKVYGDYVEEKDVVNHALLHSALCTEEFKNKHEAKQAICKLNVPAYCKSDVIDMINEYSHSNFPIANKLSSKALQFQKILNEIPDANDDDCGHDQDYCDLKTFQERSKRVAKLLRDAAKLLPPK